MYPLGKATPIVFPLWSFSVIVQFLGNTLRSNSTVVRPAVQLLQIQEVHPVAHSSACNFLPFFIYFSYLFYLGHLSLLELQTKTRRQRNSSTFCSFKSYNPETFMSSTATAFVHATLKRSQKVPRAESGTFWFPGMDSHDSSIIQ